MLKIGRAFCKCPACGEYFGGPATFDRHRIGKYPERRCIPPGEVTNKNGKCILYKDDRGYWRNLG